MLCTLGTHRVGTPCEDLFADVAALTGDEGLAKQMAEEVLPVAEAYQFDKIAKEARDHLAGDPFFRQMQRQFFTGPNADPDVAESGFSDEDVDRICRGHASGKRPPEGKAGRHGPRGHFLSRHRTREGRLVPTHPIDPGLGPRPEPADILRP